MKMLSKWELLLQVESRLISRQAQNTTTDAYVNCEFIEAPQHNEVQG